MQCPKCQGSLGKKGFYLRESDKKRVQRYFCRICSKSFSSQTWAIDYRLRKRRLNQSVFMILCSGVSQRRCALIHNVKFETIARRVIRFGLACENNLKIYRATRTAVTTVLLDELETFEHTKCKPLTVPIAVEDKSRKILSLDVGQIAAKGNLAKIATKKYGKRKCHRRQVLNKVMKDLKVCCRQEIHFKSDQSPFYPSLIKYHFPKAEHESTKGRRGCVVGQGELKRGGFDPLFSLNHSYAMFRDNLKTLTRRTWCTAKKLERLRMLLFMYAWFHNLYLENPRKIALSPLKKTIKGGSY